MNNIDFKKTGGFPLDTNVLDFMQNSWQLLQAFGELAGNLSILQGCPVTGSTVGNGVVYINGEILPFKGGTGVKVIIKTETTALEFEDGKSKPVEQIRYATFGIGSVSWKWTDFKRVDNLQQLMKKSETLAKEKAEKKALKTLQDKFDKLEKRIEKMVPVGLVAVWDKPASDIPEGWVEHTELKGRVPVGQDVADSDFKTLGAELGEKEVALTESEMPRHSHAPNTKFNSFVAFGNELNNASTVQGGTNSQGGDKEISLDLHNTSYSQYSTEEEEKGAGVAHNNMQPSRIVKFIRFVGID